MPQSNPKVNVVQELFQSAQRKFDLLLLIPFFFALVSMALTNPDPWVRDSLCTMNMCLRSNHAEFWNSILNTLASGAVLSIFFYWLLVSYPNYQKKKCLKNVFKSQYLQFKKECIGIFLAVSQAPSDMQTIQSLATDVEKFRSFFSQLTDGKNNRWHSVMNNLSDFHLDRLANTMEILRDELRFFLLATDSENEDLVLLLTNFTAVTHANITRESDYDSVRYFSGYAWDIFAGFNIITGGRDTDLVLDAIERI